MDNEQHFEEFLADTYQENVDLAQSALDRGDNHLALELAEECLEERPFDVEVLNLCAVAATNLDDLVKAQGLFIKALQLSPKNGALHHNYAVLLDRQRNFVDAERHLLKALELQPDFPEAYINLGNVLDELERTEEALGHYREALRRMPDSHDAYYNIGYACNRLGRYEDGLNHFLRALEIHEEDAGSFNGAGFALTNLDRLDEARPYYDRSLVLDPRNPTYLFNRGLLFSRQGRYEEALSDFGRAIELDSSFSDARIELVTVLVQCERLDEVQGHLEQLEESDPLSPESPFFRALLAERRGDPESALNFLEESLRRDPDSLQVLNNKGNILLGLRRFPEAIACFDAILDREGGYALAHFNRACVFSQLGNIPEALSALQRALELDPALVDEIEDDPDFEPLQNETSFHGLLNRFSGSDNSGH